MKAELLAIGSELLGPLRAETNSLWLTERLLDAGIEVAARVTLADDIALLESAFREALSRADVVIATGGLGPTADDLTREAAAAATGRPLRREDSIVEALRARFARYGRTMSVTNAKQADVIEGAEALPNARGTAPGQALEAAGRLLVLLPGPPGEMKPMFDEQVLPRLRARAGATRVVIRRVLRIAAMPESEVDEIAAPVYSRFENPKTTILGAVGQVELHLVAHGDSPAEAEVRIEELAALLREALGGRVFSEDGRDLPRVVVDLLRERGLTLALAESCTGGLLSARVTDVPGASATLDRAFVTYANRAKVEGLGVASRAPRAPRRRLGGGRGGHGGGGPARRLRRRGRGHHRDRGPRRRHRGEAGRARARRHVWCGGHAGAALPLPGRPRAGALPGDAGRSRDAAPRAAGPSPAVSPGGTVRAFVALELDGGLRQAIGDLQARLRPRLGGIRLVRPEGIHLTLRFLGDATPSQVDALRPLLAAAAASCPPTEAQAAGLGTFPERGSPRVLWLGLAVEAADPRPPARLRARGPGRRLRARGAALPGAPHPRPLARPRPAARAAAGRPRKDAARHARSLPERPAPGRRRLHGARADGTRPPGGRLGSPCSPPSRSSPSPT